MNRVSQSDGCSYSRTMSLDDCIRQASEELGIPYDVCHRAYMMGWKFIYEKIQKPQLSVNTTPEEFQSYRLNFNIRGIGKFNLTKEDFERKNKRFLAIQKYKKEKNDKDNKND